MENLTINMTSEYDPLKLTLGKIGPKSVTFFYPLKGKSDEFTKLKIQTPRMKIPFDVVEKKNKENKPFMKTFSVSTNEIGTTSNKSNISSFKDKINQTDEIVARLLPDNIKNNRMSPSLWKGQNTNFSPTMKISINYDYNDNTKCNCKVFNHNNEEIRETELTKGCLISAIIRLDSLWIYEDKIGINWIAEQIKIYQDQPSVKESGSKFKIKLDDE